MKKQILVAAVAALFSVTAANAQFQRKTPEERVKIEHDKMDSAFHLDAAKQKQVDDIFLNFYKDSDKKMEDMRAGGQPDRDAMMAARKQLTDDRDAKLKGIGLTDAQLATWKDIEASMRPARGNRGGGGGTN